jgi:hypothetical protein
MLEAFLHGSPEAILPLVAIGLGLLIPSAIRRRNCPGAIACGSVCAGIGMLLCGLMLSHTAGVIARRLRLKEAMWVRFEPHVTFSGIPYDFRIYSLILFGVLAMWSGVISTRAGIRAAHGDPSAWTPGMRASAAMICLVLPLVPLQNFALQVVAMCIVNIIAAFLGRRYCRPILPY